MTYLSRPTTAGERGLLIGYLAMAATSAFVAWVVLTHIGPGRTSVPPGPYYTAWMVLSGAIGGAVALHLVRHRLGRPGLSGVVGTGLAAVWATVLAGLIGGTLALPLYGTMFGPFTLFVTLAALPGLAAVWVGTFVLAHLKVRSWHAERDSIFAPAPRRHR
ncbi:hypothetical protein [Wenxinia marina]|uniref:Uncharacterized protein n=1 Tax=Wenxinia marina DSM 24838 TaxID=1123501 RepID=A0A0D0Q810_9RHOB|nr:hypothetical protein [Wenxinia marina]KIQ68572.1 hypothetical protein Wenmar_02843 [Wenxinia marina DSM 24838]GGL66969.1 hypothetical protein GCM10011392_21860 [Wenxinia marina]